MKGMSVVATILLLFAFGTAVLAVNVIIQIPVITVIGRVKDVQYSAAGKYHNDLTTVYFDDGEVLVFDRVVRNISIGRTYAFVVKVYPSGNVELVSMKEVD